jgi:hypothetical protein
MARNAPVSAGKHQSGAHAMPHAAGPMPMEHGQGTGIGNVPDQHAFAMLGTDTLFLCHLTMFHMEGHMYQFVVEATLPDEAMQKYRAERRRNPLDTYFLGNSPQDLMTVPQLHGGTRSSFVADVFRGLPNLPVYEDWPWRHETPVLANITVTIRRVVYFRPFVFNIDYPQTLTYLIFGAGDEAHMTNYQSRDPEFDHILSLAEVPGWVPAAELRSGILIDIPGIPRIPASSTGAKTHCVNPLKEGQHCEVRYRADRRAAPQSIMIGKTYWFCTRVINKTNPCPNCSGIPCARPSRTPAKTPARPAARRAGRSSRT